jgi:putative SOS response-associated peptidase YedK
MPHVLCGAEENYPMCGRFVTHTKPSVYAELFDVESVPGKPNYNVAPTQEVAAVRMRDDHRECVLLKWGLIPFWSKDGKQKFINARADTVIEKPAFRNSLKKRRCLILADGYYEWRTEGKTKTPYYLHRRDNQPFAFAGLWDCWKGGPDPVESCTIITTDANELSRRIHDRMPVILEPTAWAFWLDPEVEEPAALQDVLKPFPSDAMECYAVNAMVGNVRNNCEACIDRCAQPA